MLTFIAEISVAGIVGADYVGVARAANLISVKISGIYDWVNPSVTVSNLGTALHDILKSHLFSCKYFATDDQRFRGSIINLSASRKTNPLWPIDATLTDSIHKAPVPTPSCW